MPQTLTFYKKKPITVSFTIKLRFLTFILELTLNYFNQINIL